MRTEDGTFVVVGEALVDVVRPRDGSTQAAPGGSPMNVAVGLARLDVPTLLVTELGDDEYGALVADHVLESDVVLAAGSVRPGLRTSTATALLAEDGAATYDFELTWELPPLDLPEAATGLHVGSLGAVLEPGRDAVLPLLDKAVAQDLLVSYDPNVRPAFPPTWAQVAEIAARAEVVKLSDEDVALLRPDEPVARVAQDLLDGHRTRLVVVTHGGRGAQAYTDTGTVQVPAPATDVVDTVGAGDSFMSALIAVLLEWERPQTLESDDLRTLLAAAATAAAVTCARRGANPPTRRELPPGWPRG